MKPGDRYIHNGVTVDIHEIHEGQVYFRQWPMGVTEMPWLSGLRRCPIEQAENEIKELELEVEP